VDITGKKISVIGAVRSGVGAARLAKKMGAIPFVSDSGSKEKLQDSILIFNSEGISYECGSHSERVYECDLMITSPGVPSDSEILKTALSKNIRVIGEVEFASWFCEGGIISITGTNGKTTTTALMNHTLNQSGIKCYSAGNIGQAFSEIVLDVQSNEFVALETSSFQLDFADEFKPRFAIVLNITPDHLDRYNYNFEEYIQSKMKITGNQTEDDYLIYNADDLNIKPYLKNMRVTKLAFSLESGLPAGAFYKEGKLFFSRREEVSQVCAASDLFIKGEHNIANALAVLTVAKLLDIPAQKIKDAFSSFKGVEHRIEFVRDLDGVEYYNDSKATNVDSVIVALKSFIKPVYLILGGKDKGNNYDDIRDLVIKHVKKIYAIGVSSQKIYDYFSAVVEIEQMESLEDAVVKARLDARAGSAVLLSPACASFDMFENYEHRGKVFKQSVNNLV